MSKTIWEKAESAPPGTESVEMAIGAVGGNTQPESQSVSHVGVVVRQRQSQVRPKTKEVEKRTNQHNQLQPVSQSNAGITNFGGEYRQEQQIDLYVENHKREKRLRTIAKEKERFSQDDAFEYLKEDAYRWMSVTPPQPLPEQRTVDASFPAHVFPIGAQRWIEEFAAAYGRHSCVGGAMLLGDLSICEHGKFIVRRHDDHVEPLNLYQLIIMSSGKLKSPMQDTALRSIKELEKRLQEDYLEQEKSRAIERRVLKRRIAEIEKSAAKNGGVKEAVKAIAEIEANMPNKVALPQLLTFKFTPEGLEKAAAEQGGCIAIAGAELGSLKKIQANKDDFILQAWSGESFVSSKVKNPIRIERPSLSILIATQEMTSLKLLDDVALQEDGLVARFMCLVPPDMPSDALGGSVTRAMSPETCEWLESMVNKLYDIPRAPKGHHYFEIDDDGLRTWDAFFNYCQWESEKEQHPTILRSWYRKLAGTALRFAGFLHLLKHLEGELQLNTRITAETIRGGIELARFYEAHAHVALDIKSNDLLVNANKILKRILQENKPEITIRDLYHAEHMDSDDAKDAVRFLAELGYLVWRRKGKSDICLINPHVWQMPMMK